MSELASISKPDQSMSCINQASPFFSLSFPNELRPLSNALSNEPSPFFSRPLSFPPPDRSTAKETCCAASEDSAKSSQVSPNEIWGNLWRQKRVLMPNVLRHFVMQLPGGRCSWMSSPTNTQQKSNQEQTLASGSNAMLLCRIQIDLKGLQKLIGNSFIDLSSSFRKFLFPL